MERDLQCRITAKHAFSTASNSAERLEEVEQFIHCWNSLCSKYIGCMFIGQKIGAQGIQHSHRMNPGRVDSWIELSCIRISIAHLKHNNGTYPGSKLD